MQLATLLVQRSRLEREVAATRADSRPLDPGSADRLRWSEARLEMIETRIEETVGAAD